MANKGRAQILTQKQRDLLLKHLKNDVHSTRLLAIYALGYYAGLRIGTIAQLTLEDVIEDFSGCISDKPTIKTVVQLRGETMKYGKHQTVYFTHPTLRKYLEEWLRVRPPVVRLRHLFITRKNTPYSPNSLSQLIKKKFEEIGLKGHSSHSFRRSFATNVIDQGGDITHLKTLMNHSDIQTTSIYVQHDPNTLTSLVNRIQ